MKNLDKDLGWAIVVVWPDTTIPGINSWYEPLLLFMFFGRRYGYKCGHTAILLISSETREIQFYDFGRYITPKSKGRLRGNITDPLLIFPFKAKLSEDGELQNQNQILDHLYTLGATYNNGRRICSPKPYRINFKKADERIIQFRNMGIVPFGPFYLRGSNCSRFVNRILYEGSCNSYDKWLLQFVLIVIPTPYGNVWPITSKGSVLMKNEEGIASSKLTIWQVISAVFTMISFSFYNGPKEIEKEIEIAPDSKQIGFGKTGAWFTIEKHVTDLEEGLYGIKRYYADKHPYGQGIYDVSPDGFDIEQSFEITFPSHSSECSVIQNGVVFKFRVVKYW